MNFLHGEYIYDGSHLMAADSAIDSGHEAYILQSICSEFAEELVQIAKELNNPELEKDIKTVSEYVYMGEYNPDDVYSLYDQIRDINSSLVSNPKLTEAMNAIRGDARKYGCKYLGYIIIRQNNFEVWEFNKDTAKKVVDAVHEMLDEHMDILEDEEVKQQEVVIYSYKTDKSITYTVEDLESGNLFKAATIPQTKASMHIPQPTGTRAWQARYTSESFSFKNWLFNNY
jgi:hypothetical protein